MKTLSAFVVALIALSSAAFADTKIGVFDAQQVLDGIDEGKKAVSTLDKEGQEKKKVFESRGKELEKMKSDLDSQKLVLSKDAYDKKEKEFQAKAIAFEQDKYKAHQEMQKRELTLTGEIFKKINAVIQKIGKESGYDFIFEKNQGAVTYFKSGDLTQQVITEYNKAYSGKK